jgi:uncharacterized membrane-anchored protein
MKMSATTLGETGGDWLSMTMGVGYLTSTIMFLSLFLILLVAQLWTAECKPLLYWSVIVATSTSGTTLSDYMDRTLELGYAKGSAILIAVLIVSLTLWKRSVGNISVNSIHSRKAESFYWFTVLVSNTLGTALGDFLADDSSLGFFGSWILVSVGLLILVATHYFTRLPKTIIFWCAFILTRPFGATFGDLLTKSTDKGGIDLGTGTASIIFLCILFSLLKKTTPSRDFEPVKFDSKQKIKL